MNSRQRVTNSILRQPPCTLVVEGGFSAATWNKYREALEPLARRVPIDFYSYCGPTDYDKMPIGYGKNEVFTDAWGCVWECRVPGMQGIIIRHPLASGWDAFGAYLPPDPLTTEDLSGWSRMVFESSLSQRIFDGKFVCAGGERLWERVHFLRGYENAMVDMAENAPQFGELILMIVQYNIRSIEKYTAYSDVDCIMFQDDWGEQNRLMVSPAMWRKYFYDGYRRMFEAVHKAGKYVYFHTDGHLMPVIPDLIAAGVDIINLQSACNDLHQLYRITQNKTCISVDIDRQFFMPFGTPEQLKQHVRDIFKIMHGDEGGLWVKMDVYPDTPLANIQAMCEVFEELRS